MSDSDNRINHSDDSDSHSFISEGSIEESSDDDDSLEQFLDWENDDDNGPDDDSTEDIVMGDQIIMEAKKKFKQRLLAGLRFSLSRTVPAWDPIKIIAWEGFKDNLVEVNDVVNDVVLLKMKSRFKRNLNEAIKRIDPYDEKEEEESRREHIAKHIVEAFVKTISPASVRRS